MHSLVRFHQACTAAANDADDVNVPTANTDACKRNQPTDIPGVSAILTGFLDTCTAKLNLMGFGVKNQAGKGRYFSILF